jgi:hypothetical protein
MPLAIRFPSIVFDPGAASFELEIDGTIMERRSFDAVGEPA